MQFPIEAAILKKSYVSEKACCNTPGMLYFVVKHMSQKEICNISRDIVVCNEEVLSQQSFKYECSFQLKKPSRKGHVFLQSNAATRQGLKKFLQKKEHFSERFSILCQTVVHLHCWHGASSTHASCHLANTSCCLANLYKRIPKPEKNAKK